MNAKVHARAKEICEIHGQLYRNQEVDIATRMVNAFGWLRACYHYSKLTPEEIASMAASTFEHVHLLEMPGYGHSFA